MNSTAMFLQNCSFARTPFDWARNPLLVSSVRSNRAKVLCSNISFVNVADVLHNKVLVAATVSAAIGQLSKPFTSTLFYGRKFDLRTALQAGGFPSTHSSAVVATATCLALERGFADSIFGLAVVYAGLIMYDAQKGAGVLFLLGTTPLNFIPWMGVRREVGTHAKELNKFLLRTTPSMNSSINGANDYPISVSRESPSALETADPAYSEKESSFQKMPTNSSVLLQSEKRMETSFVRSAIAATNIREEAESAPCGTSPLKESIGHTEIEVTAGALLGFLVSLAICLYI